MAIEKTTTRAEWAERITAAHARTVLSIIETGQMLVQAKEELPHGEFGSMVHEDLPFGSRAAQQYMSIASDHRLADPKRASHLPSAQRTLYELSRLDEDGWERVEPHLSPEIRREEVKRLASGPRTLEEIEEKIEEHMEAIDTNLAVMGSLKLTPTWRMVGRAGDWTAVVEPSDREQLFFTTVIQVQEDETAVVYGSKRPVAASHAFFSLILTAEDFDPDPEVGFPWDEVEWSLESVEERLNYNHFLFDSYDDYVNRAVLGKED